MSACSSSSAGHNETNALPQRRKVLLKRIIIVVIVLVVICFTLQVIVYGLLWPTSWKVGSVCRFIDIYSGKVRMESYFLWVKVSDTVTETECSVFYRKYFPDIEGREPAWKFVGLSPLIGEFGCSPGTPFDGAIIACNDLMKYFRALPEVPEARKKELIGTFMNLLQTEKRSSAASLFVSNLWLQIPPDKIERALKVFNERK